METILAIGGSGAFAALAAILAPILLEKLKRRNQKEDARDAAAARIAEVRQDIRNYKDETAAQLAALKEATEQRMDRFEGRLLQVAQTTDALVKNEVARTYVSIRRQALGAVRAGCISARDKEALMAEYERYTRLPNANGFLRETMSAVSRLRVIVEEEDLQ